MRLWPQAIFVRGYQWDLEMKLRKLATGSAEADTRRALANLPEPSGAAGGGGGWKGKVFSNPYSAILNPVWGMAQECMLFRSPPVDPGELVWGPFC